MAELLICSWKDIDKVLLSLGCEFVRQKGSHRIYKKEGIVRLICIPEHKVISKGVLLQNIRNLNMSKDDFIKELDSLGLPK